MDLLLRALFGGVVVSLFAIVGDVIKPISWAGLPRLPRYGLLRSLLMATPPGFPPPLLCGGCEKSCRGHAYARCAASIAAPTRNIVASSKCLPSTCTPIGRPAAVVPAGTLIPQMPAKDAATE